MAANEAVIGLKTSQQKIATITVLDLCRTSVEAIELLTTEAGAAPLDGKQDLQGESDLSDPSCASPHYCCEPVYIGVQWSGFPTIVRKSGSQTYYRPFRLVHRNNTVHHLPVFPRVRGHVGSGKEESRTKRRRIRV